MKTLYNAQRDPCSWAVAARRLACVAVGALLGFSSYAEEMFHPLALGDGGGVAAQATITSQTITTSNATLSWYGMQGWYTVEMSTNLTTWTAVGSTAASTHSWSLTVPNSAGRTNDVFFRLNQANSFVGQGGCAGCHGDKYNEYLGTKHATAYNEI